MPGLLRARAARAAILLAVVVVAACGDLPAPGTGASPTKSTASGPSTANVTFPRNAPVNVSVGDALRLAVKSGHETHRARNTIRSFRAHSPIHLWLTFPDVDLGVATADASGRVQTTVTVPDVNPGVHQLEVNGEAVGGRFLTDQILIRVAGRPSGFYRTYLCCFQPTPWEGMPPGTVTETISITAGGVTFGDFPTDPDGGVQVPMQPTLDGLRHAEPLVIEGTGGVSGKKAREVVNPIPTAPSLWATSTAADAIAVTGARFSADGRVHSEGGIELRGAAPVLTGGVEYGTVLDSADVSKTITPPAVRTASGQGDPAVPQMEQYRPGPASLLSRSYRAISKSDCVNGAWTPPAGMVLTGVVYVPCGLTLTRPGIYGAAFAAEGPITISGSKATVGQPLPAGAGRPSLITAAAGANGIRVTGADITLLGQALAPAGQVQVSGARVALGCGVVASRITVSGADSAARMSARCLTH